MRIAAQSSPLLTHSRARCLHSLALLALTVLPACTTRAQQQPSESEALRKARIAHFLAGRVYPATIPNAQALAAAKTAMRTSLAKSHITSLSPTWSPVGPGQVTTAAFGPVTGRVTSIALDPADPTGNTVYVGTTGGGVWKSTNAAGPQASVSFAPLTDTLAVFSPGTAVTPSLSIGALAIAGQVILAGTGDPNDATDSYYGTGILRSTDGGTTWSVIQQSIDGAAGNHSFFGLGFAGFAFSSLNPSLAVAAVSQSAEGDLVNAASAANSVRGLYYSSDAGITWHLATVRDGSQTIQAADLTGSTGNAATAIVWNPIRQRFYAAIRFHGYYESADGISWTRLAHQPAATLTTTACPANSGLPGSSACPIFRGALAVQPATGDTFALTVSAANAGQGLYRDTCNLTAGACSNSTIAFAIALNAAPLESASNHTIAQGDYNLTLAAAPAASDTLLYVGTIDLYRCSLAAGCTLRNTTNAQNGCASNALVAPAQHAIATLASLLYLGNDGGLWRSTDAVNQAAAPCSLDDANHFQNLNPALGSLAEVVDFAQSPADPNTLLAGLGALGTAGTASAASSWPQLAAGEGGYVALDPQDPQLRYLAAGPGISFARCANGSACTPADFATPVIGPAQTSSDPSAIHAPYPLDPVTPANLILGTCRVWRGPAAGGSLWSSSNAISAPLAAPATSGCTASSPLIRSVAAAGSAITGSNPQNSGSPVLYAGLAGTLDGGHNLGGHLFVTTSANTATNTTPWTDAAKSPVTNDTATGGIFNPGGFDVSAVTPDPHDPTGRTVYATVMGFDGNGIHAPHLYRSLDAGAHWLNISSNLPNAPANSVAVDPNDANTLYVALDTGVFVTTAVSTCASTNCWSSYGNALPNAPVTSLLASAALPTGDGRSGMLRAATYGRGIWQVPLLTAAAPAAAAIALSPVTVTYSPQQTATLSPSATITVTNTGTAPLTISSIALTGDFIEADTCIGSPIAPAATCTVSIRFAPTVPGARTGLLTIYANIPGGQATAALSGTATPPAALVLTPVTLTFAATNLNANSIVQNITLSNTGGNSANIQPAVITGDFHISANTCGNALGPQSGCTISIVFTPTASGTRTGTLTFVDDAGTQVASLTGTGTSPATDTLAPLALTFPATELNLASPTQAVTLTNSGDVALTLIAAQITSGDFTAINACGNSLNAHSSCSINVAITPKSIGALTGTLTVGDQFRNQTVILNGIGLAPPGVTLSPSNGIAFGAVGVSLTSGVQTVSLTNNGGVPLSISSIAPAGDYLVAPGLNTCPATLAPAAVCTVGVVFAPATTGARSGSLTFMDSAASSPQTIAFTGTGVDFTLNPSGSSSMTASNGQSAVYALLLDSAAGLPGAVTFACTGNPAHTLCTVNPAAAALGGTTPVNVTIATGQLKASLHPPAAPWHRQLVWLGLLLPLGLARRRTPVRIFCASLIGAGLTLGLAGCAVGRLIPDASATSGTTGGVTASGTYTIAITATSTGLSRTVNLTLIVK